MSSTRFDDVDAILEQWTARRHLTLSPLSNGILRPRLSNTRSLASSNPR
jgi:hypothetical protein